MAENITIVGKFTDNISGPVTTMAGNVDRAMKKAATSTGTSANAINSYTKSVSNNATSMANNVNRAMAGVNKSTQQSSSSLDKWAKRLLTFEVARRLLNGVANSLKEFDKQTGGTNFSQLTKDMEKMSLTFASALQPLLVGMHNLFKTFEKPLLILTTLIGKLMSSNIVYEMEALVSVFWLLGAACNGVVLAFQKLGNVFGMVSKTDIAETMKTVEELYKRGTMHMRVALQGVMAWGTAFRKAWEGDVGAVDKIEKAYTAHEDFIRETLASGNAAIKGLQNDRNTAIIEATGTGMSTASAVIRQNLDKQLDAHAENFRKLKAQYADQIVAAKGHYGAQQALIKAFKDSTAQYYDGVVLIVANSYEKLRKNNNDIKSDMQDLNDKLIDNYNKIKEADKEIQKAHADLAHATENYFKYTKEQLRDIAAASFDAVASVSGAFSDLMGSISSNLDKQVEKEKEAVRLRIMGKEKLRGKEKQLADEYERIEKAAAEKRRKLRNAELAGNLVSAIANTAAGAARALDMVYPLNLVAMASVIAAGAIQSGIIVNAIAQNNSNTAGYASGGIVGGERVGDRNLVRANAGEVILNGAQQRRLMTLANGGGTGSGQGIVIHENITVNGNLDMAAADKVRNDREKQLQRLKMDIRELSWRGQLQMA